MDTKQTTFIHVPRGNVFWYAGEPFEKLTENEAIHTNGIRRVAFSAESKVHVGFWDDARAASYKHSTFQQRMWARYARG